MTIIMPIQIISLFFVFFAASRAILQFRGGSIRLGALSFWLSIWAVVLIAIFYPEETSKFANLLGIGRGVDIVMYSSIAVLFYLVFRLHVHMEDLRSQISSLVREISLKEVKRGRGK